MDLRLTTFDLLYHDAVLRPLLVNYADWLEHGRISREGLVPNCFVRLRWTAQRSSSAPTGAEVLAVEAHMPRCPSTDHGFLSFVLQRLHTTLSGPAAAGSIAARCLRTSASTAVSAFDTLFTTSAFEIAPTPRPCQSQRISELVPWTGWAQADWTDRTAPRGGTPGLN